LDADSDTINRLFKENLPKPPKKPYGKTQIKNILGLYGPQETFLEELQRKQLERKLVRTPTTNYVPSEKIKDQTQRVLNQIHLHSRTSLKPTTKVKGTILKSRQKPEELEEKLPYAKAMPVLEVIAAPYGTTKSGIPRLKAGPKGKKAKLSQEEETKRYRESFQEMINPAKGKGIHHSTLKRTIGRGIVGMTYVARR